MSIVRQHFLLWNHYANWTKISYGDSLGLGDEIFSNGPDQMTKMAATPLYGKNPLKSSRRQKKIKCVLQCIYTGKILRSSDNVDVFENYWEK